MLPQPAEFIILFLPLVAKPIPPRTHASCALQHPVGVVIVEGEGEGFEVVVVGEVVGGLAWFGFWLFNVGYYGAYVAEVVG